VRIFFSHEGPQRGKIADEVSYDRSSVLGLRARNAQRDVGRGEGIRGDDYDC
jgi:hypothetical protein